MKTLFLAAAFLAASYLAVPVLACSCRFSEKRFDEAKAVFYGKILEYIRDHEKRTVIVKVQIERVFKGAVKEVVVLHTGYVCGYNFQVGEKYLIYAGELEDGDLETGPCRILNEGLAKEEMKYLEKGKRPRTRL
jgi:hypothetical protein